MPGLELKKEEVEQNLVNVDTRTAKKSSEVERLVVKDTKRIREDEVNRVSDVSEDLPPPLKKRREDALTIHLNNDGRPKSPGEVLLFSERANDNVYHLSSRYNITRIPVPYEVMQYKYDVYTSRRGVPNMLQLFCQRCHEYVMTYQKDGHGRLLRCYLDRIKHPPELEKRQREPFRLIEQPDLECSKCSDQLGEPMIYRQEKRPAYRLFPNRTRFLFL